jgi:hypothetical protein
LGIWYRSEAWPEAADITRTRVVFIGLSLGILGEQQPQIRSRRRALSGVGSGITGMALPMRWWLRDRSAPACTAEESCHGGQAHHIYPSRGCGFHLEEAIGGLRQTSRSPRVSLIVRALGSIQCQTTMTWRPLAWKPKPLSADGSLPNVSKGLTRQGAREEVIIFAPGAALHTDGRGPPKGG